MVPLVQQPLVRLLLSNRNYQFWLCQIAGWGGYSLVTFLSITLVDDNVSWPHIGHLSLSAILGILITWPLRPLYNRTFRLSIPTRLLVSICAAVILSGVWNVLRILIFARMVGEDAIWDEFNHWYFGSLSIFLGWTVLYYAIKYYELLTLEHQKLLEESSLKKEEQFARLQAESSARHAQLQMLRYQLNPHFLFNTLNAINALVTLNENHKASEMIQQLSDFLRHTLEHGNTEEVSLGQELESLMLYLNIEKTRFEDGLVLEFEIQPLARQALVPGLILQPIVENSIKYAIAASEDGGTVRVSARVLADELELQVSDSGPGENFEDIAVGSGIGLSNTIERLDTLYPDAYSFESFESVPSGLTIQIRIPFKPAPMAKQYPGGEQ
jgi:two-component system LytT family sensor kinase